MTLRKKTLLVVAIVFVIIIGLLYFVSEDIFLGNLVKVEEDYTRQDTLEALNALSVEISSLEAKASDWSAWDDTYAFIEDVNNDYIQSNLVDSTFTTLNLNLIMYTNASGKVAFSKAYDLYNRLEIPLPASLNKHISPDSLLITPGDTDSTVSGILMLDENPMLITSQPILTSNEEGPSRGRLIMGRYLDGITMAQLGRHNLLSITIQRVNDQSTPPDFQLAMSSITEGAPVFVHPLSDESIAGYALVDDLYGNLGLILRIDAPRDIHQQARANTTYFIWLRLLIGLALVAGIMLFLEKQILSRLSRLGKSLSRVAASKDPSARVELSGSDELSSLANTINGTLSALQQSERTLYDNEARYRALFEQSMDPIFITTREGKFIEINKSALDMLGYTGEEILNVKSSDTYAVASDRKKFQEQIEKSGSVKDYELKVRRKDGTPLDCIVTASVQRAEDGSILGYQTTIRDISERKRAEAVLQDYKMAVETSNDLITVSDSKYVYLLVNRTFLRYFGLTENQVIARNYVEVVGEELFGLLKPNIDRCLQGETVEYEAERNFSGMGKRFIDVTYSPIKDSDGHVVGTVATARDITERKQAEELFRTLANSAPIGIYIVQDGTFQYTNAPFAEIVGYSPGQLHGRNPLDIVFPEDRERVKSSAVALLKGLSSQSYEYRIVDSSGKIKWVMETMISIEYHGKRAALGNFVDITQRRMMEEELRDSEQFSTSLLESAPNPIVVLNPDMSIKYANLATEQTSGFSRSELVGKTPPYPFFPEQEAERFRKGVEASMKDKMRTELRFRKKNGELYWVELRSVPVSDNGQLKYVLGNWSDITERKRADENLQASYEHEKELRKKLEEEINKRVEFTRALVHELKTPLTPVLASSELLASDLQEEPWTSLAKNIYRSAISLNDRVDELLDIARGEIGMLKLNPGPLNPLELLEDVAHNVKPMLSGKEQTLGLDLPSSLKVIHGDEERLRQVLLNLLNNASKYTPRGGKITISARERDNSLVVEVEDNGPGIAKEDQWQLFTPYRRLENEGQRLRGLGLGLALSKTLVELHGGKIWVESDKGKGSIFGFSIPGDGKGNLSK